MSRPLQDAGTRRLPLQRKVGAGITVDEFRVRVEAGTIGHVGLRQSAAALAAASGWELAAYKETIGPIVASQSTVTDDLEIEPNHVLGLHQIGTAYAGDRKVVNLDLWIAIGRKNPRDHIQLIGEPDLELIVPGGLHDMATASVVVNSIDRVIGAASGLRVMSELALPHP